MSSSNHIFASSPTIVLPPNGPVPFMANNPFVQQTTTLGFADPTVFSAAGSIAATPGSLAGRKRSRGDVNAPEDDDDNLADGSVRTPPTEELECSPGKQTLESEMTIDEPQGTASQLSMESRTDSVDTDRTERETNDHVNTSRPPVTSRKSQRMGSTASGADDLAQLVLPPQMREVTTEPLIDEATRSLGISWTRMDSSEALRISQAAYSKWIQNHYPGLKDVAIWFENSAIPGYLVTALNAYNGQREYYIFSNDLTEARLVTSESSQLVPRLKMLPALHLAAPGGCIRAETDPITAAQNELNNVQAAASNIGVAPSSALKSEAQHSPDTRGDSVEPLNPDIMRSAHEMEVD